MDPIDHYQVKIEMLRKRLKKAVDIIRYGKQKDHDKAFDVMVRWTMWRIDFHCTRTTWSY